jgi:hypothetical protein
MTKPFEEVEAWQMIHAGRFVRNPTVLRRCGLTIQRRMKTKLLADFFPAMGFLRALLIRNAYQPLRRRGVKAPARPLHELLFARFMVRVGFASCWFSVTVGEYLMRRRYLDRPGWNDYYMVLWLMTGDRRYAQELYRRASLPDSPVSVSCRWMVNSVSQQYPDFGAVMTDIELATRPGDDALPL